MRPIRPTLVAVALAALAVAGCSSPDRPATETPGEAAATTAPTPTPTTPPPTPTTDTPGSEAPASPTSSPLADRISDPQVAADRLIQAWLGGDRAAARTLASQAVVDRLFSEPPPAERPATLPCRLATPGVFVCSYPVAERAEVSLFVEGGASAGYHVNGVEFGD
jgi:hypothetical protein